MGLMASGCNSIEVVVLKETHFEEENSTTAPVDIHKRKMESSLSGVTFISENIREILSYLGRCRSFT